MRQAATALANAIMILADATFVCSGATCGRKVFIATRSIKAMLTTCHREEKQELRPVIAAAYCPEFRIDASFMPQFSIAVAYTLVRER